MTWTSAFLALILGMVCMAITYHAVHDEEKDRDDLIAFSFLVLISWGCWAPLFYAAEAVTATYNRNKEYRYEALESTQTYLCPAPAQSSKALRHLASRGDAR